MKIFVKLFNVFFENNQIKKGVLIQVDIESVKSFSKVNLESEVGLKNGKKNIPIICIKLDENKNNNIFVIGKIEEFKKMIDILSKTTKTDKDYVQYINNEYLNKYRSLFNSIES